MYCQNTEEWFLKLRREEVRNILVEKERPNLGVFVPDGSRRLVLAYTDLQPGTQAFNHAAATLPAGYVRRSIQVFFEYGLFILFVPVLGNTILKRGTDYQTQTLLEVLRLLFDSQEFQALYDQHQVQVKVYGRPENLAGTACEPALDWIRQTCSRTSAYRAHKLYYGIGGSTVLGVEAAHRAVTYYHRCGHMPTLDEQIADCYGEILPPADFFIMTSKMGGMSALPDFLVNGDTENYYLPTMMGLTEVNYRRILYDLLYRRSALRGGVADFDDTPENRSLLRHLYDASVSTIVGDG